jgi:cytochrome c peroxidase
MTSRAALVVALAIGVLGCAPDLPDGPDVDTDLDGELRPVLAAFGAVPIGVMPAQSAAEVTLGRALMFDKILSGNRDISCATCHLPSLHATDGLPLSIGTGGTGLGTARTLGPGRRFVPRNAPSLLDQGLRSPFIFWDGRVSGSVGRWTTPAPALPGGLATILAAQAMFPVLSREEMRGDPGDRDVFGAVNELAGFPDTEHTQIWDAVMRRLLAIPEYVALFQAAYPQVPAASLGFQHAATAIAAFETEALSRYGSPFDRYLDRDNSALNVQQKRGALLFFGRAQCATCHQGALLGGNGFFNDGVPQLGPGSSPGAPQDWGRGATVTNPSERTFARFQFRVPPLRNVELSAPYMHNGAYPTLEAVIRHYNDPLLALRTYDPAAQLPPQFQSLHHPERALVDSVAATIDGRLRTSRNFSDQDRADLVAFLKSLTDPAARDLSALVPDRVPSGLPVDR